MAAGAHVDDQHEGLTPEPELKYVLRKLAQSWNAAIDNYRMLVLCIPKVLPGSTPIEKLQNKNKLKTTVFYTLLNKSSSVLRKILLDETLVTECDFFYKQILPPCGVYNMDQWIAAATIYYILHTNLGRPVNDITFELLMDHKTTSILTSSVLHQIQSLRDTIDGMITNLERDKLFCLGSCSETCKESSFSGHFSLLDLKPLVKDDHAALEDNLSSLKFRYNLEYPSGHLKPLLFPSFHRKITTSDRDKVNIAIDKTISGLPDREYTVYILLTVTPNDAASAELHNLLELWENEAASFELYIGSTVQIGFRSEHISGAGRSAVHRRLRQGSSLFLVNSQVYSTYEESRKTEALLIDLCKIDNLLCLKNQNLPRFSLINTKSERLWFCALEEDRVKSCIEFLRNGNRMFRLPNENFQDVPSFPFGNYMVQRKIDLTYFDDIHDEEDDVVVCNMDANPALDSDEDNSNYEEEHDAPGLEEEAPENVDLQHEHDASGMHHVEPVGLYVENERDASDLEEEDNEGLNKEDVQDASDPEDEEIDSSNTEEDEDSEDHSEHEDSDWHGENEYMSDSSN